MDIQSRYNAIVITTPGNTDTLGLQRMIDYLKYKEATASSDIDDAKQGAINLLAAQSKADWWKDNKHRFIQ